MNKWFVFTLIVCLTDCILPFILACFYPGYSHMNMVLSSLGSERSQVRTVFNIWMACLGVSFIFIGIHLFVTYKGMNPIASTILLIITISYAVFDCIISSLFSVGDSKEMVMVWLCNRVHIICFCRSASGNTCLEKKCSGWKIATCKLYSIIYCIYYFYCRRKHTTGFNWRIKANVI
nr:hypothetical protein [uncultured Anaerosporobacter sp.]